MERENEISTISGRAFIPNAEASIIQMSENGYDSTTPKPHSIFLPASLHADPPLQLIQPSASNRKNHHFSMCNDPYCTTCPSSYISKRSHHLPSRVSDSFDKVRYALYDADNGCVKRILFPLTWLPVVNHHSTIAKWWVRAFAVLLLLSISIDPLFFFLLSAKPEKKCTVLNWPATKALVIVRSIMDFIYLLNMLFQSRLTYIDPESTVTGAGESVDDPLKVAIHYFRGKFFLDLFIVFPIPQLLIIRVIPQHLGLSGANVAKNFLLTAILIQYIPKLCRFVPLIAGKTPIRFIFESGWSTFVINLLSFMLAGHVVGSFWYLFGVQRITQCLKEACATSFQNCRSLIDCGHGDIEAMDLTRSVWRNNPNATSCFKDDGFSYGIYAKVLDLSHDITLHERYFYSLFWGFQQISTLAGNLVPSHFVGEVLFTMGIVGLGLLLLALLIGNMQNFLQSFGIRKLEMVGRKRDIDQWMRHRCFPRDLKKKVQEAEQYNWAATGGINEETLIENLNEDLQRDIRRHLFKFLKEVKYFNRMDDNILDAIRKRLRPKLYLRNSIVLRRGDQIEKIVFIMHGEMKSLEEDGSLLSLSKGDVCGKELLTWFLDPSSVKVAADGTKTRTTSMGLLSSRLVICNSNVEAFTLSAADLEDILDKSIVLGLDC